MAKWQMSDALARRIANRIADYDLTRIRYDDILDCMRAEDVARPDGYGYGSVRHLSARLSILGMENIALVIGTAAIDEARRLREEKRALVHGLSVLGLAFRDEIKDESLKED